MHVEHESDVNASIQTIGKYEIIGTLGRGSQGVVYKAKDPEIGRIVAIKTLRAVNSAKFHDRQAALKRFKTEARSAGNLRHPNIITVFDVNIEDDTPYIVMDYVEGESLDAILAKHRRLDPKVAVYYLAQIAAALDAAHKKGVIHRDIKPSNLIVDASDTIYILDFGIAKAAENFAGDPKTRDKQQVMGTPGYMSPEQILNEKLDYRSDLFSLGVVAFECLTGQRPFVGDTFTAVVGSILNEDPESITNLIPTFPKSADLVFDRVLSRDRSDRFSSAREFVSNLKSSLTGIIDTVYAGQRSHRGPLRERKMSSWMAFSSFKKASERSEEQGPLRTDLTLRAGEKARERASKPKQHSMPKPSGLPLASSAYSGAGNGGEAYRDPGDIFSHAPVVLSGGQLGRRSSMLRAFTIFFSALFILLAVFVVWTLMDKSVINKPDRIVRETVGPSDYILDSSFGPEAVNPLPKSEAAPIPFGKTVPEMSDKEILGVLISSDVEAGMILEALAEGKQRNIAGFVEAAIYSLESNSYVIRNEALKTLAAFGDRRAVPNVVLLLDDHDPIVRANAATALGALGSRAALGYLSTRLRKEESVQVKKEIKGAIERINGFPMSQ